MALAIEGESTPTKTEGSTSVTAENKKVNTSTLLSEMALYRLLHPLPRMRSPNNTTQGMFAGGLSHAATEESLREYL